MKSNDDDDDDDDDGLGAAPPSCPLALGLGAWLDPTVRSFFFKFCSVSVGFLYLFHCNMPLIQFMA